MTAWKPHGRPLDVDETAGLVEVPYTDAELAAITDWLDTPLPDTEAATTATEPFMAPGQARDRRGRWTRGGGGGGIIPITAAEARGNSRPVSAAEFDRIAAEGRDRLQALRDHRSPPEGLDMHWDDVRATAYAESQKSWGGATFDAHTGRTVQPTKGYVLSIKNRSDSVTVEEGASRADFDRAMDTARSRFGDELSMQGGHLGVFHDDDEHRIDIDPVIVVDSLHEVETIGAATHAIGGAYSFEDGNGYWPPHIAEAAAAAVTPPKEGEHHWRGLGEWYRNVRETQHTGQARQASAAPQTSEITGQDVEVSGGKATEEAGAVTIPVAGSQEGPMPWKTRSDHPDCSGFAVVNSDTGKMVPGGCHKTKKDAEAHSRALWANAGDEAAAAHDLLHFAEADNSTWDANAAMSACDSASCYRAICAGRKAGPPDQRSSWALPHHKTAGGPPNANGVRAALARFSSTEGLTNAGAARRHLEAHMAAIRGNSAVLDTLGDTLTDAGEATEELADQSKGHCPPGKVWNPALGRCVSPPKAKTKMGTEAEETEQLDVEETETLGGDPNPGTAKDKRLKRNRKRDKMAADPTESAEDGAWEGILTVEGIPTGDGREFAPDSLVFADMPLPLTYQPPTHGGEPGPAIDVGVIDEVWRDDGEPRVIRGRGRFDMKDPVAADYHRKVDEGFLRGMSVDLDDLDPITDVELAWSDAVIAKAAEAGVGEDEVPMLFPPSKRIFHKARVRGAALLSMPAFVEAQMVTVGNKPPPLPDLEQIEVAARAEQAATEEKEREAVTAAAIVTRLDEFRPPTEWFENPQLGQRTPITVTDEGRVYGHAWRSGECHIGYGGECVTPPEEDEFPFFTQGSVLCADGSRVAVGQITIGTGHAPLRLGQRAAAEHYDNTGAVVADVAIGMDRVGAWVAGCLRPGATAQQVYALRASGQVSGDWRSIGGRLRLVALLGVNVPGFPVPRAEARVAGGQVQALVAAGMLDVGPKVDWEAELEQRALRSMRDKALAAFGDD